MRRRGAGADGKRSVFVLRAQSHRCRAKGPRQREFIYFIFEAKFEHHWAIHPSTLRITIITELLRAGASLDACSGDQTAEDIIQRKESNNSALAGNEHWKEIKALVHGVRQHGSYKRYARSFHRDVLAVRGLAQRGKLSTSDPVLNFLARLGDNGVVWHVLEYWRATN